MYILGFQAVGVSCTLTSYFVDFLLIGLALKIMHCAVSGGVISMVQGSYEYHHYLQDGYDDSVIL